MRIAIWHNLPSGGGKRALYDQVRGLVSKGHTVRAWTTPLASQNFLPLGELIEETVVPYSPPEEGGSPLRRLSLTQRRIQAMHDHCRLVSAEIESWGPDVGLSHTTPGIHTPPIGRYTDLPTAIYLHEPTRALYEALPVFPWIAPGRKLGAKERLVDWGRIRSMRLQVREEYDNALAFDRILVNSFFSRDSVLRCLGLEAHVCYLGVDFGLFEDRGLDREAFVLGLGSIHPRKNVIRAVEGVAAVPKGLRPPLVWVGDVATPEYGQEVRGLAESLEVDFRPLVGITDAQLVEVLNRATAMVYCSRLEPFGYAPIEANACGCPVVAVAEGGIRETVVDGINGLVVDGSAESIGEGLAKLLSDPKLAREIGSRAATEVRIRWAMEPAIERLEAHLRQIA